MNTDTSRLKEQAFSLFGVETFSELSRAYTLVDQMLMRQNSWDPFNPNYVINQTKRILARMKPEDLNETDLLWRNEILWFWYHHAISFAIWKVKDPVLARFYASKALELQGDDHPNRITRLLWLLVCGKEEDAVQWIESSPKTTDPLELETGRWILAEYRQRTFFQ